jgi:hypothetical protein
MIRLEEKKQKKTELTRQMIKLKKKNQLKKGLRKLELSPKTATRVKRPEQTLSILNNKILKKLSKNTI